jgi:FkbM family methyltransferase
MNLKSTTRKTLNLLKLDLTRNLKYDRLTAKIMKRIIRNDSNCVDIGCHKGEILDLMLHLAPNGQHFAFEPIPEMAAELKTRFNGRANILEFALADHHGTSTFSFVRNAAAYSGLKKREYNIKHPDIEQIDVNITTLDATIPENTPIRFIKIDVEGGEFGVFKGAIRTLQKNKPYVVFESGLGASEFYGTNPVELFRFINGEAGLKISRLEDFSKRREPLSEEDFAGCFNTNSEWYYIAHP